MKNLLKIRTNLEATLQTWQNLDDEKKRLKINFILPLIQLASYLNTLQELNLIEAEESKLSSQLDSFAQEYQKLFGQTLAMNQSDFNNDLFQAITKNQQGLPLAEQDRKSLLQYQEKYVHAHARVMFNYGKFLNVIHQQFDEKTKEEIATKAKTLSESSNQDTTAILFALNNLFELEKNSASLEKDDLENHALLNQMSDYLQHFSLFELLQDDEETKKITHSLSANLPLKSTIVTDKSPTQIPNNFNESLKLTGLSIEAGIETEFLLDTLEPESEPQTAFQRNATLKKNLADLNARRKMQTKYGLQPTIPEIPDITKLYEEVAVTSTGAEGMAISKKDFLAISKHIKSNLATLHRDVDINVANFTKSEAFFYNLLFLNGDFPQKHKIEIDGVYDYHKSTEENLKNVWELIKVGRFHEHLLDMIQANEIAFGPHDFSKIIATKNEILQKAKLLANQSELSLNNPNVQLNLSLWLEIDGKKINALLPQTTKEHDETKIEFSQLGVEFLRIVEESIVEATSKVQGILRHQENVNAALDRKKNFTELLGTKFLDINANNPAFWNHKNSAAKNVTARIAKVNDETSVLEVRLVGNNTHFAKNPKAETIYLSGLEFIPEALLPEIALKMEEFLQSKTKEDLIDLYHKKVEIGHDGKIAGLEPVAVSDKKKSNIFDTNQSIKYDQTSPAKSVAVTTTKKYNDPQLSK